MCKVEIKERKTNKVICYINYPFCNSKANARFYAKHDLVFQGMNDKYKVGKAIETHKFVNENGEEI